jgi:hypothetical protein
VTTTAVVADVCELRQLQFEEKSLSQLDDAICTQAGRGAFLDWLIEPDATFFRHDLTKDTLPISLPTAEPSRCDQARRVKSTCRQRLREG